VRFQQHCASNTAAAAGLLCAAPAFPLASSVPAETAFKAGFELPATASQGFVTVRVPFSTFSVDTSEYTGRCDTTDPNGLHHHCCSAAHPEVCPTAAHLRSLTGVSVWAEGVAGDFELELARIEAGPP
jgi:hypothetical protein